MADFKLGQIVFSKCGRDKGLAFVVTGIEGEFLYLADGKLRRLEKPKRKKIRHVQPTNYIDLAVGSKLYEKQYMLDSDIRKCIDSYRGMSGKANQAKG